MYRSGVELIQANDQPQQDTLACAAAAENCQGFSLAYAQIDPVQDCVDSERLVHILDRDSDRTIVAIDLSGMRGNVICSGHDLKDLSNAVRERPRG